jgi:hypothetical protein
MPVDIPPEAIVGIAIGGIKLLILAACGIYHAAGKIDTGLNRRQTRKTVQRLLARPSTSFWQEWRLPAPESYSLFSGIVNTQDQPFKAGILQLLADRVLTLEVFVEEPDKNLKYGGSRETILGRGTSTDRLEGSLAAIYHLWEYLPEPRTIGSLANQARKKYGSLANFTEIEVKPRLVDAGLYTSCPLTPREQALRDELESRMAAVLCELKQERSTWIDENPQQALLGAVVAVTVGRPKPAEETEMDLIAREVKPEADQAVMTPESTAPDYYQPVWIDWAIFNNLEKTYAEVDTGCDADEQSGDGSEGDSGNGDGGDYGGFGDCG